MRLAIAQFRFLPDASGLKVCLPGKATALARLVPDEIHAGMWRVVRRDGSLSDMVNKVRAKDVAFGLAEAAVYLRLPPQSEPAKNGHFFQGSASRELLAVIERRRDGWHVRLVNTTHPQRKRTFRHDCY